MMICLPIWLVAAVLVWLCLGDSRPAPSGPTMLSPRQEARARRQCERARRNMIEDEREKAERAAAEQRAPLGYRLAQHWCNWRLRIRNPRLS